MRDVVKRNLQPALPQNLVSALRDGGFAELSWSVRARLALRSIPLRIIGLVAGALR